MSEQRVKRDASACAGVKRLRGGLWVCGFLSDENIGSPLIAISSNSVPQLININFQVEDCGNISLKIYDVVGRLIKTLGDEKMQQGDHQIEWNTKDEEGNAISAGIYILQLDTGNRSETKKVSVIN